MISMIPCLSRDCTSSEYTLTFGTRGKLDVGVGAVEGGAVADKGAELLSRRGVMLAMEEDLVTSGLVGVRTPWLGESALREDFRGDIWRETDGEGEGEREAERWRGGRERERWRRRKGGRGGGRGKRGER